MNMKTIKNKLSEKLRQYVAKPGNFQKESKEIDDYVHPMEGDTVRVSERIDEILYGKER